jgi:transcriptional regulator with XRE-family HTH domain
MSDQRTTNTIDKRLGARVRARRVELGISQERLADLLGVTFQQVQKYEKGVNRIAASRLFQISEALELPIGSFFEGIPSKTNSRSGRPLNDRPVEDALAVPGAVEMVRTFASIGSTKVLSRVLYLVRAMEAEDQS